MHYADACRELGVNTNCSAAEAKSAYRKLVRQYHPDMHDGSDESSKRFQKIQAAYDLISAQKPQLRSVSATPKTGPATAWPGNRSPLATPVKGQDVTGALRVSLKEVFTGTTAEISFDDVEPCQRCGATGAEPGSIWVPCPPCQGMPSSRCEWCGGEGQVPEDSCTVCGGCGVEQQMRTVRVAVPRSAKEEQSLRVRGKGRWGLKGRGDIKLDLKIDKDPVFSRSGDDLERKLDISLLQAVLGGEAEVYGLDEAPYRIAVTPGSSSGKRFRLAGRGLYRAPTGDERGDLFAVVSVQVPETLTERQRQLYQLLLEAEADED